MSGWPPVVSSGRNYKLTKAIPAGAKTVPPRGLITGSASLPPSRILSPEIILQHCHLGNTPKHSFISACARLHVCRLLRVTVRPGRFKGGPDRGSSAGAVLVLPMAWHVNEKVKFTNCGAEGYRNSYSQPACISGGEFKSIMALAASMSGSGKVNQ